MKNFYYKYFLKYLIYCIDKLFLFMYYWNIIFKKFILKNMTNANRP